MPEGQPPTRYGDVVTRDQYVQKALEARYCVREPSSGRPALRLVDSGDRLSVWSSLDGGALLNPKGVGLRALGLASSYVRGGSCRKQVYGPADLGPGTLIELRREPYNEHDPNAVAMLLPGDDRPLGYVQRGRAPAVSRRMAAGEKMLAVSLRGPCPGDAEESTLTLLGERYDVLHLLS